MQAWDHVNKNLNYLLIQITTVFTWKSERKLELLSIYAFKKNNKTEKKKPQGNEKVEHRHNCQILDIFSFKK